jgi:hypothetical protein
MCVGAFTFATNLDATRGLLESMSPALQQEVAHPNCQALMTEVPYLKGCEEFFLAECAVRLGEVIFAPMELAITEGKPVTHLLVIRKGVMVARGRVMSRGRVFGQESLYKDRPASFSVRSMTFTDVSQLAHGTLLRILKRYPDHLRSFTIQGIQVVFKCALSCCFGCSIVLCAVGSHAGVLQRILAFHGKVCIQGGSTGARRSCEAK